MLEVSGASNPVAGTGQVVVGVSIAPVLTLDTQLRRGWGQEWFRVKPPYAPGAGLAGKVLSAGEGANPDWIGRRVVADVEEGGYAERAVVTADGLVPVPDGLDLPEAAALLHNGRTALGLVEKTGIYPDEWVLVTAAAGRFRRRPRGGRWSATCHPRPWMARSTPGLRW